MSDDDEKPDMMSLVDLSLTFTAPIISTRQALLGAGMSHEQVEHIVTDFAHFLLTSMTAQALSNLDKDDEPDLPSSRWNI